MAGAGTGKTSVMIARAAYLLKKNLVDKNHLLMLAYGDKAAKEMKERAKDKLKGLSLDISTFHSLGQKIVAQVEGYKPSLSIMATDEKARLKFICSQLHEHMRHNEEYQEKAFQYFNYHLAEFIDPFRYEHKGDYLKALKDNSMRTLNDDWVKGYGEYIIANFLYINGIEYTYEAKYEHPTMTLEKRQYQPDFFLSDYGIYLEHYGIGRNGVTAPFIDEEQYNQSMQWKRDLHKRMNTPCMETFHYNLTEGKLLEVLTQQLKEQGVQFRPRSKEELLANYKKNNAIDKLSDLLFEMQKLMKSANHSEADLRARIPNEYKDKFNVCLDLLMPLHQDYQNKLRADGDIDFDDMVNKAISYLKDGRYKAQWKYIMVDEFQDISSPRANLVQALRLQVPDSSLFCVGDDWQAIYRFAGSDLSYTTKFEEKFGTTQISKLDKTFRFNNSICDIAAKFISQNPEQMTKRLETDKKVSIPAISLVKHSIEEDNKIERLEVILKAINARVSQGASVMILERYKYNFPKNKEYEELERRFPKLKLKPMTIHSSKGKEADFVIIPTLQSGVSGLPSQKLTPSLIDFMLPPKEYFKDAEERRLFYVALTRAKDRVYLISDMAKPSEFVKELLEQKYPLEYNEFISDPQQALFEKLNCQECETGKMLSRSSAYGKFFGCSHFPLCDHTDSACTECDGYLQKREDKKVCLTEACSNWIKICRACGADMIKRTNRSNGNQFWGCKNFSKKDMTHCSNTESL